MVTANAAMALRLLAASNRQGEDQEHRPEKPENDAERDPGRKGREHYRLHFTRPSGP